MVFMVIYWDGGVLGVINSSRSVTAEIQEFSLLLDSKNRRVKTAPVKKKKHQATQDFVPAGDLPGKPDHPSRPPEWSAQK